VSEITDAESDAAHADFPRIWYEKQLSLYPVCTISLNNVFKTQGCDLDTHSWLFLQSAVFLAWQIRMGQMRFRRWQQTYGGSWLTIRLVLYLAVAFPSYVFESAY